MKVPLFDARREFEAMALELTAASQRVLRSGCYVGGPEVAAFEAEASARLGVAHAVAVASGTDAIYLALAAAGVGPGDLVITSTYTFFATASAVLKAGASPVLVDIDPGTFNLDVAAARAVMEGTSAVHQRLGVARERIRAIVPVHLFGQPADMAAVTALAREFGLVVVEDAAQAFGARCGDRAVGAIGHLGAHSFFPTKNLGGFGDGGLVSTDDAGLAGRARLLRAHGATERYRHVLVGTNSRLDPIQAALLRVRLAHLDEVLEARRSHAACYRRSLSGVGLPEEVPGRTHTYNQYVVRVAGGRRDDVRASLASAGVSSAVYYPAPLHLQEALACLGYRGGDFPVAEAASLEVLALPVFPTMRDDERCYVVEAMKHALSS